MKVVTINKHGVIVWERDLMGQHTIHLRNYNNQIHYKADISYFVKVEKIEEDSLDSIPSPSVKIQIFGGKLYLR